MKAAFRQKKVRGFAPYLRKIILSTQSCRKENDAVGRRNGPMRHQS